MLELNFTQTLGSHRLHIAETLPASGITAIFGVSGAGKTSLINAIGGLTQPQEGRIVLNDRVLFDTERKVCLPPEKRRVGYVLQDARDCRARYSAERGAHPERHSRRGAFRAAGTLCVLYRTARDR